MKHPQNLKNSIIRGQEAMEACGRAPWASRRYKRNFKINKWHKTHPVSSRQLLSSYKMPTRRVNSYRTNKRKLTQFKTGHADHRVKTDCSSDELAGHVGSSDTHEGGPCKIRRLTAMEAKDHRHMTRIPDDSTAVPYKLRPKMNPGTDEMPSSSRNTNVEDSLQWSLPSDSNTSYNADRGQSILHYCGIFGEHYWLPGAHKINDPTWCRVLYGMHETRGLMIAAVGSGHPDNKRDGAPANVPVCH